MPSPTSQNSQREDWAPNFEIQLPDLSGESESEGDGDNTKAGKKNILHPGTSNVVLFNQDTFIQFSPVPNLGTDSTSTMLDGGLGGELNCRVEDPEVIVSSVQEDEGLDGTTPEPNLQKPFRHINTYRKNLEWEIVPRKPVLFIGDSNLARFPDYNIEALQVDSFPGAKIDNITNILEKLSPHKEVQKLVVSVGINNCMNGHKPLTMEKNYSSMVKQAKRAFPHAEVFISIIQTSVKTSKSVQILADEANKFLRKTFRVLEGIPEAQFQLQQDKVHWTAETAENIFNSWVSQLN